MGLRPTKGDEAESGADPRSARVPLDPLFGIGNFFNKPTRASAADQGVRPTWTRGSQAGAVYFSRIFSFTRRRLSPFLSRSISAIASANSSSFNDPLSQLE
jgi:hypothetical protein